MVYIAFVVDIFSRAIVGWAAATNKRARLVLDALDMALWRRDRAGRPVGPGLVHHSDARVHRGQDRGRVLSARHRPVDGPGRVRTRQRRRRGAQQHAQGRVRAPPPLHTTRAEARIKVSTWIADFYNTGRRHSAFQ
ncbi:hypothetical protein ACFHW2_40175 [Actinomadura sp. LOL_016]|uniref:hypothetical protein n=1 Tax=unclassified Actinomadura TaxID=2626254 RepID=UPI003A809B5F